MLLTIVLYTTLALCFYGFLSGLMWFWLRLCGLHCKTITVGYFDVMWRFQVLGITFKMAYFPFFQITPEVVGVDEYFNPNAKKKTGEAQEPGDEPDPNGDEEIREPEKQNVRFGPEEEEIAKPLAKNDYRNLAWYQRYLISLGTPLLLYAVVVPILGAAAPFEVLERFGATVVGMIRDGGEQAMAVHVRAAAAQGFVHYTATLGAWLFAIQFLPMTGTLALTWLRLILFDVFKLDGESWIQWALVWVSTLGYIVLVMVLLSVVGWF